MSFSVAKGETFGFLGPNGAGKTTTIRILTGISRPTSGSATIFGKNVVTETIAARKEIGIVHETSNVYDDMSAWKNLMFSAELPIQEVERVRGRSLLELFGLWDRQHDRVKGFSKVKRNYAGNGPC
ncbi:MAG: ABC transporter ATP-binding protein [Burkholderiales bacterium]|nr:ABC transporter ATP-binding protein [Burkholderiales bacterium]